MASKDLRAVDHPELALVRHAELVDVPLDLVVKQPCLTGAIALCQHLSGLDDKEVYLPLGIDAGHWSRIKNGDAHFPLNKMTMLMDLCGNEAPLMWLANARGKGLVLLKSEAERRADEANARADSAEAQVALLKSLLVGRAT